MHDNDDLENLTPDSIKKKDKHKELLDKVYKLEDMNDYSMISDGSFLPSSLLKEQNKKPSTISRMIASIRSFYQYEVKVGKIEEDPNKPSLIKTVWGKGYRCD